MEKKYSPEDYGIEESKIIKESNKFSNLIAEMARLLKSNQYKVLENFPEGEFQGSIYDPTAGAVLMKVKRKLISNSVVETEVETTGINGSILHDYDGEFLREEKNPEALQEILKSAKNIYIEGEKIVLKNLQKLVEDIKKHVVYGFDLEFKITEEEMEKEYKKPSMMLFIPEERK